MDLLIVDDEKREIAAIRKLMEDIPIRMDRIYEAYNMKEAVKILKMYPISLLFCDVEMPGGTGLELADWVREYDDTIQIIYLTGHADFSYVQTALRLGAVDYLLKPVDRNSLEEALRKAVKKLPGE